MSDYSLDVLHRLVQIDQTGNLQTQLVWDDQNMLYQRKRRLSGTTYGTRSFEYDPDGRITKATDATGLVSTLSYDALGRKEEEVLPDGRKTHYSFASSGSQGDLLEKTEFKAVGGTILKRTTYSYDSLLRTTSITTLDVPSGNSRPLTIAYNQDAPHLIASQTRELNRASYFFYDDLGRLTRTEDSLGNTTGTRNRMERIYQAGTGLLLELKRSERREVAGSSSDVIRSQVFAFDGLSRVTKITRKGVGADHSQMKRDYDSLGNLVLSRDWAAPGTEDGVKTIFSHDALGRIVLETIHPRSGSSTIELERIYDDNNRSLTRKDQLDQASVYLRDEGGRLVEKRLPGYTGGSAYRWLYTYDAEGRMLTSQDGNDAIIHYTYDNNGRLQSRYLDQGTWTIQSIMLTYEDFLYDEFDRATSAKTHWIDFYSGQGTPPVLVDAQNVFDYLGRNTSQAFSYLDQSVTKTLVSGYSFGGGDDPGFRRSLTYPSGFSFQYVPDGRGALDQIQGKQPGGASYQSLADYAYEGSKISERKLWSSLGSSTQITSTWSYDDADYLTDLHHKNGSTTLFHQQLTRDATGNILATRYEHATGSGWNGEWDWFQLDGYNRLVQAKFGVSDADYNNGSGNFQTATARRYEQWTLDLVQNWQSYSLDNRGLLTSKTFQKNAISNRYDNVTQNGQQDALTYDGNGNLVSDGRFYYVYDYLDRLSEVYEIVPGGQTLAASSSGGTALAQAQCARCMKRKPIKRSLKELRALYKKARDRYALAKNRTALAKGVPLSQSGTTSANSSTSSSGEMVLIAYYGYDPDNRRTYRLLYGTTTWWSYDGWRVAEEMDGGTSNFPAQRVHLDGIGIDEHLATWAAGTGWTRRSYLQNHQSSTMRLLDGNGALLQGFEYDAYGNRYAYDSAGVAISTSAIDGAGIYGYTGRRLDAETGFYYFRNRYLNVGLGRFLTMDLLGRWWSLADLGNPYVQLGGNPRVFVDPFGFEGERKNNVRIGIEKGRKFLNGGGRIEFVSEYGYDKDSNTFILKIKEFTFKSPCTSKKGDFILDSVCLSKIAHEWVHLAGYILCMSACFKKIDAQKVDQKNKLDPVLDEEEKCDKKCTDLWLESMKNPNKKSERLAHWFEGLVFKVLEGCK